MICLNLFFTLLILPIVKSDSVVQTDSGTVQGTTVASGKVEAFLGIPYAEPPVGPLRFAKPVPKTSWKDVHDATRLPPPCIQSDFGKNYYTADLTNMSEDCLYLNVWVPRTQSTDGLKPIMLFIHGGGFVFGSSTLKLYDGATLSGHGDVVVVTINYRLGALGFFTDFTDNAPGSIGLYDQVMALQWIKKNAKHFHGDPENIVLFGESAGAFSVSMHQISPLSKSIFRRAILQSGSALNPLYSDDNEELSKRCHLYAELLSCADDKATLESTAKNVVDCLRNVPAEKFSEVDMEIFKKSKPLYPRIGNDFLPKSTIDAYRQGHFKNSEVLIGITRNEGSVLLTAVNPRLFGLHGEKDVSNIFNETTAYLAIKERMMPYDPATDDDIIQSYLDRVNEETGYTYLEAVSEAVGDDLIVCGSIFQAEYQSMRDNPVYYYMFDHRPSSSVLAEWMGVAHFDEVQFVFGNPMIKEFTEYETELSRDIMDMWVSFAKTGNPNIPSSVEWPRYTYQEPKYFIIGKRDRVGSRPDHHRCEKWRNRFLSEIDDAASKS